MTWIRKLRHIGSKLVQRIGTETDGDYTYIDVTDSAESLLPGGAGTSRLVNDLGDAYMTLLEKASRCHHQNACQ